MFQPIPTNERLEKEITTPDSLLRKEFKEICDHCGALLYEGPNVGEARAMFDKHMEEEHEG